VLIFERKIFRRIYGPKYENGEWKSRTNRELEEMSKGENIVKRIGCPKRRHKKKGKTHEKMERGSRKRSSSAGSEKMETVGGRGEDKEQEDDDDEEEEEDDDDGGGGGGRMTVTEKLMYLVKSMSQQHFVYQTSHMDWTGINYKPCGDTPLTNCLSHSMDHLILIN